MTTSTLQSSTLPPSGDAPATGRIRQILLGEGAVVTICWFGLLFVVLGAFVGPLLPWLDAYDTSLSRVDSPPSWDYWLGTDGSGRDVLARVLVATRTSLIVGVSAVSIYMTIATLVGMVAGYFGGIVDILLSRLIDALLSIPLLLLVTVFIALLRPGIVTVILVIGLLGWPATARIVRAQTLTVREQQFVAAARVSGTSHRQVLRHHILPNLLPVLTVAATLGLGIAILMESTVSFLGLGIKPPAASLGSIIATALDPSVLRTTPWAWVPAAVVLAAIVIMVNLIGDSLRNVLDPTSFRGGRGGA